MASKIHKAVDICFDKSIIDIPVWKEKYILCVNLKRG
jgi:hypothetical protein